jgi:nitrite reductase (NADH) large subunit
VYSELNMPLRTSQKHTIRFINTSFGEQYCQCHKENALQLSIDLEKELEYLLTPNKVVLAVAACKHSPVEVMTKDFSVIGFKRGWEIYIGGSISPNMKQGELFTVAKNDHEAMDLICGLVQYYRETANYLEQVSEWVDRVGLIHLREVLFDDVLRALLIERLEIEKLSSGFQFVK